MWRNFCAYQEYPKASTLEDPLYRDECRDTSLTSKRRYTIMDIRKERYLGTNVYITATGDSVYWATQDTIYAFDSHTGKQRWSQPGQQTSDMVGGDNLLYIASGDLLYPLDRRTGHYSGVKISLPPQV